MADRSRRFRNRDYTFQAHYGYVDVGGVVGGGNVNSLLPRLVSVSPGNQEGSWYRYRRRVFEVKPPPPLPRRAGAASAGATAVTAPLAGTIASVRVAEGDAVVVGDLLVTLDAMKMEHRVLAPSGGVVKAMLVKAGDVVREGDVLAEVGA